MQGKKIACEHQYMMGSDFRHTLQGRDGFFFDISGINPNCANMRWKG